MGDQYSIAWEKYGATFASNLETLRKGQYLCDVTLVSDDDKQIQAHKVILASSSKFFEKIFKENFHKHPLIYLSGICSKDINFILDYIYKGEAKIYENDVDLFLKSGKKLKIAGLSSNEEGKNREEHNDLKEENPRKFQNRNPKFIIDDASVNFINSGAAKTNPSPKTGTTQVFGTRIKATEGIILPPRNVELQHHQILPKGRQSLLKKHNELNFSQNIVKVVNNGENLECLSNATLDGNSQKNDFLMAAIGQESEKTIEGGFIEVKSGYVDDNLLELKERLKKLGDFENNRCKIQDCRKIVPTTDGFVRHLLSNHLEISNCLFCNQPFPNSWSRSTHKNSCKIMKEKTLGWFQ